MIFKAATIEHKSVHLNDLPDGRTTQLPDLNEYSRKTTDSATIPMPNPPEFPKKPSLTRFA